MLNLYIKKLAPEAGTSFFFYLMNGLELFN